MPSDRPWSDTDRELVAAALVGTEGPTWVDYVQHRPVAAQDTRNDAAAVLDALTAAGWRPPEVTVTVEHTATVRGTGTYRQTTTIPLGGTDAH